MFLEINIHFILKLSLIKQYVKFQQPKNEFSSSDFNKKFKWQSCFPNYDDDANDIIDQHYKIVVILVYCTLWNYIFLCFSYDESFERVFCLGCSAWEHVSQIPLISSIRHSSSKSSMIICKHCTDIVDFVTRNVAYYFICVDFVEKNLWMACFVIIKCWTYCIELWYLHVLIILLHWNVLNWLCNWKILIFVFMIKTISTYIYFEKFEFLFFVLLIIYVYVFKHHVCREL